jgi:hypothetical protein
VKSPTNQSPITLSASNAYKTAKIDFYQDGTKTQELKSDKNGKFSAKVELKEGDNKFKAAATNEKGKSKTSSEINIVYDKTPPTLVLSQTEIKTDSDKAEISGETEKNSTLTLWVDDKEIGKTTAKDGKFKFDVKDLKNGENKFIIKVTDEAGNVGEQKEVVITYTPPAVTSKTTETPTPTTTPTKEEYQQIANYSGEGDRKTNIFTVTTNEWYVDWSVNPTAKDKAVLFAYDLYDANNNSNAIDYFTAGGDKTSDRKTYKNGPGTFYLQVWATENNWSISIRQPK